MLNAADNKISTLCHIAVPLLDRGFEICPLAGKYLDLVVICLKTVLVVSVFGTFIREDKDQRTLYSSSAHKKASALLHRRSTQYSMSFKNSLFLLERISEEIYICAVAHCGYYSCAVKCNKCCEHISFLLSF